MKLLLAIIAILGCFHVAYSARVYIVSDLSARYFEDAQFSDILCFQVLVGYVENQGNAILVEGATYHASPMIEEKSMDDPIIEYVKYAETFDVIEASTVGQEYSEELCRTIARNPQSSVGKLITLI